MIQRNNVHVGGTGQRTMVFAHGFGCDQNMWRFVEPAFSQEFRTVLFDHVGAGGSDLRAYDKSKYSTLSGYADDIVEIGHELDLKDAVFVGHSVSSMIGMLAAQRAPGMFGQLVMVGPSPRYIDDGTYVGGFSEKQIEELLQFLELNHMGWSAQMAPAIMGNPDRPELGEELTNSFCRTDPEIAKAFARVTFTSDNRADLANVEIPTLILQCSDDIIASAEVGEYVRRSIPNSKLVLLEASGHCPNLSASRRGYLRDAVFRLNAVAYTPHIDDFEDMLENAPCGYVTLLPNGHIERVNKTLLGWTGHTPDQMSGRRFSDFLNIAGRIFYETHIAPLLRMQGTFDGFAIDIVTATGEQLSMIASARDYRDSNGKALFTRFALIKATDRRIYERGLLDARDAATTNLALERETAELREQFIAVLGHDLRNPLASISAGARILGRDAKTEKEHQVIAMLETTVMRMAGLIDNVLDFARGRLGGGIALERNANREIEPMLHQVIDELRLSSPGRQIEAEYEIDVPVNCDRSRIGQLLSNLVGNALSHGATNEPVRVRAATENGLFTLSVTNGGEPISTSAMERLFEPFFRGEARASRQGLGLGLHIASQIAKAHEGTIGVTSTDKETTFTFSMPLR